MIVLVCPRGMERRPAAKSWRSSLRCLLKISWAWKVWCLIIILANKLLRKIFCWYYLNITKVNTCYPYSHIYVFDLASSPQFDILDTWTLEHLNTWVLEYLNTWILGILDYLNTWMLKCSNTWILASSHQPNILETNPGPQGSTDQNAANHHQLLPRKVQLWSR